MHGMYCDAWCVKSKKSTIGVVPPRSSFFCLPRQIPPPPAHRAGGVGDAVPRGLGSAQTLGAGAIHLPRAGPIPLAPKAPGKLCFPGDPLPPGLKKPRLHRGFGWRQRIRASPAHASPGTRVSGTAWVRRHKRFGATPQNLGAGRIHSARACPMGRRSPKKEDVLPDVLFFWSE